MNIRIGFPYANYRMVFIWHKGVQVHMNFGEVDELCHDWIFNYKFN